MGISDITEGIFGELNDDATLLGLLSSPTDANRVRRSWPRKRIVLSSAAPAYLILSGPSTSGRDSNDGFAESGATYIVHIFAFHFGAAQKLMEQIAERIDVLLDRKVWTSGTSPNYSMLATNTICVGKDLDQYDTELESHHGIVTYQVGPIFYNA